MSMTITLIIIIISISIMYYVMRGVLSEPTMSRSKDKYDLNTCIYRIYYMLLNICDCVCLALLYLCSGYGFRSGHEC